ncbi:MAG: porphobilinogen synthase [Leptospiraceae bacterium]|nr:porphobilinogen synthase [Leptospiraceae bacterium]MDW7976260.1 porphobilinogen synthase [Leptospiraceae bacterium]
MEMLRRPRRNRKSENIRNLVRESNISVNDLIMPLFVKEGSGVREPISSMPGIFRLSPDEVIKECKEIHSLGIPAVILFPAIPDEKKDPLAKESYNPDGLYPQVIRMIKQEIPDLIVITDVAMDPYSSDGHDGIVKNGEILNDETLEILGKMALVQAKAGADVIAPSDMMDGRVKYLRTLLDSEGYKNVSILSYTAKYASAFYGPFRDALDSAPRFGDKKTYQMDPANIREALLELHLDIEEGADIVMVKPGLPYLDVVREFAKNSLVPVAVYNVSGEYAMLKAASQNGWLDYKKCVMEIMLAFKRAGADMILTYHAKEVAQWLNE